MLDRAEKKQRTRENLIAAALKLSAERSFAALSLREVAKEAGITPAAFYRHFHDMDELGLNLIDEVGLGLRQLLRDARQKFGKDQSVVRASVETFIQYTTEHANLFRLLQGERQGSSPAFRKALFVQLGRFIEEVTEDMERSAVRLNQKLRDPALAAEAIIAVAFTVGGEALDLPKHRRAELTERVIKEINIILRGTVIKSGRRPKRFKA